MLTKCFSAVYSKKKRKRRRNKKIASKCKSSAQAATNFLQSTRSNRSAKRPTNTKMSCFQKFFKIHKSFDLPVFNSIPGLITKVIPLNSIRNHFTSLLSCHQRISLKDFLVACRSFQPDWNSIIIRIKDSRGKKNRYRKLLIKKRLM